METVDILRTVIEILIAGLAWYLKNKLTKTEEVHLQELKSYQLTVDNLRLKNKQLTENVVKKTK